MLLENRTKIKAVDVFEEVCSHKAIEVCAILSNYTIQVISKIDYENSPVTNELMDFNYDDTPLWFIHSEIEDEFFIVVDEVFCKELNFSEEELMACIAHEIGHIMYAFYTEYDDADEPMKEFVADRYALKMGLGKELFTTLEKLRNYNILAGFDTKMLSWRIGFVQLWLAEQSTQG